MASLGKSATPVDRSVVVFRAKGARFEEVFLVFGDAGAIRAQVVEPGATQALVPALMIKAVPLVTTGLPKRLAVTAVGVPNCLGSFAAPAIRMRGVGVVFQSLRLDAVSRRGRGRSPWC